MKEKIKKKDKKEKIERVGKKRVTRWQFRRFIRVLSWLLIIGSLGFGVYKNFTAIDVRTIVEKETVHETVKDVTGINQYIKDFAKLYFWNPVSAEEIEERQVSLETYLKNDLYELLKSTKLENKEVVTVKDVKVWNIESLNDDNTEYEALFSVDLVKGDVTYHRDYTLNVYVDDQSYLVVKNPTITAGVEKAKYEGDGLKDDQSVSVKDKEKIVEFLETFFTIYPSASEKELVYYVKDSSIKPISEDLEFLSVSEVVAVSSDEEYQVQCYVTYKDTNLESHVINQYDLLIGVQEDGEYIIKEMR